LMAAVNDFSILFDHLFSSSASFFFLSWGFSIVFWISQCIRSDWNASSVWYYVSSCVGWPNHCFFAFGKAWVGQLPLQDGGRVYISLIKVIIGIKVWSALIKLQFIQINPWVNRLEVTKD
jgi:hypothetical protein